MCTTPCCEYSLPDMKKLVNIMNVIVNIYEQKKIK